MDLSALIQQYGYVAVLLGTFVEGESIALLAGFLAHGELLDLRLVIVVSFIGSFSGDQTAYWLGRKFGSRWRPRSPVMQRRMADAERLLQSLSDSGAARFPVRLRNSQRDPVRRRQHQPNIPMLRFIALNAAGAAIWSISIPLIGYYFGETVELLLGSRHIYERRILGALVAGGLVIWLVRYLRASTPGRTIERSSR